MDQGVVFSQSEKEQAFFDHFDQIMGQEYDRQQSVDLSAIGMVTAELNHLDEPFTEDEIWAVIKCMPNDRTPGLDGYTAEFYKSAWAVIKPDAMAAVNAFTRGDR